MEENKPNKGIKSYIYYIVILVVVLIITIVTFSYAYFDAVDKENDSATVNIGGKTACISVTLSGEPVTSLTYNYPISDTFALENGHVTPIDVTITNTCTDGDSIDYSVILTALSNGDSYISADKIKVKVSKSTNSNGETEVVSTQLLNSLNKLNEETTTYTLLKKKLDELESKKYAEYQKGSYIVDTGKISHGDTIVYKTYLWIDYKADTTIETKQFNSIIGVVINNPEESVKKTS